MVRVRLTGSVGQYTTEGTVRTATHKSLGLTPSSGGRDLALPAGAIKSIQIIERGGPVAAALPRRLESVLQPLSDLFFDSTGNLKTQVSETALAQMISGAEAASDQFYDPELKYSTGRLSAALTRFRDARVANAYTKTRQLIDEAQALLADARQHVPATYMHDLRPLEDAISGVEAIVKTFWREFTVALSPRPRFVTGDKPTRVAIDSSAETVIPLRINLEAHTAPVSQVQVVLEPNSDIAWLGEPQVLTELAAGRIETMRIPAVYAHPGQPSRPEKLRFRAQLQYRTPGGETRRSPMQTLHYELVPEGAFHAIRNPYKAYAGGTTVADPRMFFGRAPLLEQILDDLRVGPAGQGLAIYGQKRSGKTSLVEQIRARADRQPVIVLSVSLGILDRDNLTSSFARAVLDKARVALLSQLEGADYANVSRLWPSDERIENRPLESLIGALTAGRATLSRQPTWAGLRYVLLVDEFTYLFELVRNSPESDQAKGDVREFLRQWKALLETRAFTSVVVGQDTMPYFMASFPNEFSTMRPIRLTYLSPEETRELADQPVRKDDGGSRYTGYGLETIYHYTAGHPFFTQVLCDRIIDLANAKRRSEISETDVEEAAESLMSGPNRLDPYRFDCLLTADNSGLVSAGRDVTERLDYADPGADAAYAVLARIADLAGSGDKRVDRDQVIETEIDERILEDLQVREVVDSNGGLKIRVYLFAEYLRRLTP
jgi:hypothetical protein